MIHPHPNSMLMSEQERQLQSPGHWVLPECRVLQVGRLPSKSAAWPVRSTTGWLLGAFLSQALGQHGDAGV